MPLPDYPQALAAIRWAWKKHDMTQKCQISLLVHTHVHDMGQREARSHHQSRRKAVHKLWISCFFCFLISVPSRTKYSASKHSHSLRKIRFLTRVFLSFFFSHQKFTKMLNWTPREIKLELSEFSDMNTCRPVGTCLCPKIWKKVLSVAIIKSIFPILRMQKFGKIN